ncbi:MAG: DUF58 domain-containing protein [Acidimicrobiia bacterium]
MPAPSTPSGPPAPEVLLRRLELAVTRRLDGLLHGDHRGLVPDHGSESGEARPYVEGDDVRRIDWNVTARMPEPHVRVTIADRELETWLVVDRSASLDFGTAATTKRELALSAAAAVALLTNRTGNRLGAVLAGSDRDRTLPPRGGREHLRLVLGQIAAASAGPGPGDLAPALRQLARPGHRRGLVAVISDFVGPPTWHRPLRALSARHDVLCVEVVDPRELELPAVGTLTLVDPETGAAREVRTSARLRRRYAEAAEAQRSEIARAVQEAGADHLRLATDRDWVLDVVRYVQARSRRAAVARRPAR